MDLIEKALKFEQGKLILKSKNDRIIASQKIKTMILGINEIYKKSKNPELMELMKRLTTVKQKVEKRLKY